MDNGKTEILLLGGLGLLVVIAIVYASRSSSSSYSGLSPDPTSVASIEAAGEAQIANYNQTAVQREQVASQTILGLAGLQENQNNTATTDAGSTARAQIAANATVSSDTILAQAQQIIAQANATAAAQIANSQGDTQIALAQQQTSQAQAKASAQQNASIWGSIASVIPGLFSLFSSPTSAGAPSSSVNIPASTIGAAQSSSSPFPFLALPQLQLQLPALPSLGGFA